MKKIIQREVKAANIEALDGIPHSLARIYAARGIVNKEQLVKDLAHLLSYEKMTGIEKACQRLLEAFEKQERLLIVGDFDADGATSTALAVSALKALGAHEVSYLVPNRFEYGYGLTPAIVEVASARHPDVIITVDNGIASFDGVAKANALGIDVIVTDHHIPAETLPEACAIVNPNLQDDEFLSKSLAGVGVIYYVLLALRRELTQQGWFERNQIQQPNMGDFLDLVALGTVADVVPLDKNNRILVHQGIERIRRGKCREGIKALLTVAKRSYSSLRASDLGFAIGPRLNAAGRLDDMSLGIECLLAESSSTAQALAQQLDALNHERRHIEGEMQQQALGLLKNMDLDGDSLPLGLCLYQASWHQGVIGILASRIKDKVHRPVICFANADNEDEIKGSARSVMGVHIRDVLDAVAKRNPAILSKFGGHAMAAGLSIRKQDFGHFKQMFDEEVSRHLNKSQCVGVVYSDGALSSEELSLSYAKRLAESGPWGQNFPEPIFDNTFKIVNQRLVGAKHLKLLLGFEGDDFLIDAIAFNVDENLWPNHRAQQIHAAYRLDVNTYRGRESAQLLIEHMEAI